MSGPVVRSPGRPRSAETERAILDAAIDLLVDVGFGGMSMEAVATRAGVGKAAIYRRFSSKEQLVVEARRLRLSLDEVQAAIAAQWLRMEPKVTK